MSHSNPNQDPLELAKFDRLYSQWWDKNGPLHTLHDINPLRFDFIDRSANLTGARVIDVGCGGGILTESLAGKAAHVTGIDLNESVLSVAKAHAEQNQLNNIDYQICSAESHAKDHPHHYDVITCMELLEHVPEPESIVQACVAMLKQGGHLFLSTINRNPMAYLKAVLAAEYIIQCLPKGTHDYARFIKPSELSNWCRSAGLTVHEIVGLEYTPIVKRYRLTADPSVNYILHTQKVD